jgi:HEAT repeat protein
MGFQFDIDWQSAGIGYGGGLLTGYAIYQSRHVLNAIRRGLTSQADSAQSFATMGGDRRYTNELTKYAQHAHLFHNAVELGDILIEPRFVPDREVATVIEEEGERRNPFEFVPIVPDHPSLYQPYNINTISIEELGYGDRAVALLGPPGSGRTTTLHTIALWSMGKLEFTKPDDIVQERLKEAEEQLSRQERDDRAKAMVAIEQRAKEQLREEKGMDVGEEIQSAFIPPFRRMAPIYVHLANVRLGTSWRGQVDPAEPLIRAIQYQTGRITSKTVPRKIYRFLNEGNCLLLIDGLDELPVADQRQKIAWLRALLDEYNQNFIIVTAPTCGYGMLQQIGFTPVHQRPWSHQDTKTYVQKLTTHWGDIVDQRRLTIDEEEQSELLTGLWGLNPFEMTMKIRSQLVNDEHDPEHEDFSGWTNHYLASVFEDAEDALPMMAHAAQLQLDHNFFTLKEWANIEIAEESGRPLQKQVEQNDTQISEESFDGDFSSSITSEADFDDFRSDAIEDDFEEFGDDGLGDDLSVFEDAEVADSLSDNFESSSEDTLDEGDADEEDPKDETKEDRQIRRAVSKLLSTMLKVGLVERYRGNLYRFRDSHIAGYLASQTLIGIDQKTLISKALNPTWSQAIAYASSQIDINMAVEAKMQSPTDILYTNILDVAHWLRYADELVEWRNKYLTYLGQMLVAPSQYLTGRERIASALVTTRDPSCLKIFGRGTQHTNPDVKRLSVLALGIFQEPEFMDNLSRFLDDEVDEVRVAAALAIGNLHTEEAHDLLSEELLETNSESVQQTIAETFADDPELGYEFLWELLNDDKYKDRVRIRRAAVLGVKRIDTDWSLVEIYRIYVESQQWYVQSTAQLAFTQRQSQRNKGAQTYPQITTLPWLREWSLDLEDESAAEASGIELLNMAMHESDPMIRYLATSNSGQLGVYENMADIYNLLGDQEDAIRDTAYRALVDLQMRMGSPLPIPS